MIYEYPSSTDPIRQGDIFKSLPHVLLDPEEMIVIEGDKALEGSKNWIDQVDKPEVTTLAVVEPSYGIVVTQDCDTERDKYIAFFQIRKFLEVYKETPPQSPEKLSKWWVNTVTKSSREDLKWFYLPPDEKIGFTDKMAVSFQTILTVRSRFLVSNVERLRIGRLIPEADEHFREHVAQYFRRYPYNEWYPLSKTEFETYKEQPSRQNTPPYDWQK